MLVCLAQEFFGGKYPEFADLGSFIQTAFILMGGEMPTAFGEETLMTTFILIHTAVMVSLPCHGYRWMFKYMFLYHKFSIFGKAFFPFNFLLGIIVDAFSKT